MGGKRVKGVLKKSKEITENLNESLTSIFTAKNVGQMPISELTFSGRESKNRGRVAIGDGALSLIETQKQAIV